MLSLPLFRRHKTSDPTDALNILQVSSRKTDPNDTLDFENATKAFASLQSFIAALKTSNTKAAVEAGAEETDILYEMYLRGFYIACTAVGGKPNETGDLREAARQCLLGYLALERHITKDKWKSLIPHLIGSIVSPSSPNAHLLAPLFELPRRLTRQVQEHHIQRAAKNGPAFAGTSQDPVKDNESLAIHLLDLLDIFGKHVESRDLLPAPSNADQKQTKAKMKAEAEENKARPKRLALEAHMVACELSTALANADIAEVKARARGHAEDVPDLISDDGSSSGGDGDDEAEDVKPKIETHLMIGISGKTLRSDSISDPNRSASRAPEVRWDDRAEATLLQCFGIAASLVEERHMSVLTRAVHASDWLDQVDHVVESSSKASPSLSAHSDIGTDSEAEEDSDTDDEDSSSVDVGSTPLRTIFRLQDRYEELRLAVWLSLPPDSRGKMSAYMRGIPTMVQVMAMKESGMEEEEFKDKIKGRIGEAWDRFALALLKRVDG